MRIARQSWIVNLRAGAMALTVGALAVSVAACSSSGGTKKGKYGFQQSSQDSSSAITVWVDSPGRGDDGIQEGQSERPDQGRDL